MFADQSKSIVLNRFTLQTKTNAIEYNRFRALFLLEFGISRFGANHGFVRKNRGCRPISYWDQP